MPIVVNGQKIETDEEGSLVNCSDWSEDVATAMAEADGLVLTPDHRELINFIREYYDEHQYEQFQISPNQRLLPKAIGKKLGAEKGNTKYLYKLFPYGGPAKQAGKYAGLPRPHGCP